MILQAFIKINGKPYPAPNRGLGFTVSTAVNSARNENNVFQGQRVGRDVHKIDNVVWFQMDAMTWSNLLQEFEKSFVVEVEFPDMVHNCWQKKKMYPGDRSAEPLYVGSDGLPTTYKNCKCNMVDTGE